MISSHPTLDYDSNANISINGTASIQPLFDVAKILDESLIRLFSIYSGVLSGKGIRVVMNRYRGVNFTNSTQGLSKMIGCGFSVSMAVIGLIYYPNNMMPDIRFRLYTTALFSYFFFKHTERKKFKEQIMLSYNLTCEQLSVIDQLLLEVNAKIKREGSSSNDNHKLLVSIQES